jgi:hypothetical protein
MPQLLHLCCRSPTAVSSRTSAACEAARVSMLCMICLQGMDISPSMLDVAVEREVEGDLCLGDLGQGLPIRAGTFDGAISISAVQWLCNAVRGGRGACIHVVCKGYACGVHVVRCWTSFIYGSRPVRICWHADATG